MPATGHVTAFALTALVIIVIPGPSVTFIVARALAYGRKAAVLTVVGNTFGEYIQVMAVAFGIGAVAERSVAVLTGLNSSKFLQLFLDQFFTAEIGSTVNDQTALMFAGKATSEEAAAAITKVAQG